MSGLKIGCADAIGEVFELAGNLGRVPYALLAGSPRARLDGGIVVSDLGQETAWVVEFPPAGV